MKTSRAIPLILVLAFLASAAPLFAPAAARSAEPMRHEVVAGDNLHLLAAYYYRNPRLWEVIWKANRGVIRSNASLIPLGISLTIPNEGLDRFPLPYAEWRALVSR